MVDYNLPKADIEFLLTEVLNLNEVLQLPGFEECDQDTFFAITEAIGAFAKDRLLPINKVGDEVGAKLEDGQVIAAPGFSEAYKEFCTDGWNALPLEEEHGGQQLPFTLHAVLREAMAGANLAFALIHELNFGVYEALMAYGSEELKELYLPRLAEGNWAGTMCLTEPHCGTDLGLIRSKASRNDDGTFSLEGNKIFITWGDHDMSDNVVHLVLARIEGAEPGVRGLSLFVAPKYLPDENNNPGVQNDIKIVGLEEKMGIHGSPTCAVSFEGAKGWLVGQEGRGLAAMFIMMNAARLSVGLQGLGIAETAYQSAYTYAHDRLQGKAMGERLMPDAPADPLIVHPDVRRRLAVMKAELDSARALAYWGAGMLDEAHRSADKDTKQQANARISALTPVLKSYISDLGDRFAYEAVQMYGGHGFVKDYGVEQLSRDVRITAIYEGTNAVQAIDLVTRKLKGDNGEVLNAFVDEVRAEVAAVSNLKGFEIASEKLAKAADIMASVTDWALKAENVNVLTGACDYLNLVAVVLSAKFSVQAARVATQSDTPLGERFKEDKLASMNVYITHVLPRIYAYEATVIGGIHCDVPVTERFA